ncbi:MAG: hypothetical protein CME31_02540 [Gimesia sp.]|uniref:Leucine Rich repeats (2 copies) n=1 Tax=Gimesia maris TaxID=122 RepID=A0A3D3R4U0_9PLAN|nr:hypothetical protein [Gimesia sp.]HCO23881.1 hypothetical protein [Gimesia maris]|tara:strand:+ start:16757 stop:17524 length:768 start_codon:yes stop_codon:yes gene_type:complete
MFKNPNRAPSNPPTPDANAVRKITKRGGISVCIIVLLVTAILLFSYRDSVSHDQKRIQLLGGTTRTGLPPIYAKLAYTSHSPKIVRSAFTSKLGQWIFGRFQVIYTVDLRGVRVNADVKAALKIAKDFEHVNELILYQSAVTDDDLAILKTGFPKLERIKLNETAITDAGIVHLRDLPELRLINAQRTAITDAAVPDLAAISRLKELNIAETQITSVKLIRSTHPICHINGKLVTLSRSSDVHRASGQRSPLTNR